MKRKPSMRTEYNRKVKATKHNFGQNIYFNSKPTTTTFATDGLVAGDIITISDSGDSSDWGVWTGSVVTIGGDIKSPKSVHPARKRKQTKKYKMWNTRIEQTDGATLTFANSGSISCKKIDDTTWRVVGDVTI